MLGLLGVGEGGIGAPHEHKRNHIIVLTAGHDRFGRVGLICVRAPVAEPTYLDLQIQLGQM